MRNKGSTTSKLGALQHSSYLSPACLEYTYLTYLQQRWLLSEHQTSI